MKSKKNPPPITFTGHRLKRSVKTSVLKSLPTQKLFPHGSLTFGDLIKKGIPIEIETQAE